jgi:hypothetical protein
MDLVTLIAACALSVEPKIMHALIFEQSGGAPWSFSVPGESLPRVLPTLKDAIREARDPQLGGVRIRVGLTGLSVDPRAVTAVSFAPCPNITLAARQLTRLEKHCKSASKPDPIYCAIAAYHGSWNRPDTNFAGSVRATVEKGNAPNFDMPKDAYFDGSDTASDTLSSDSDASLSAAVSAADDRVRGWSSALFPPKPTQPDSPSADVQNDNRPAEKARAPGPATASPATSESLVDSLFVPRSSVRRSK